MEVSVCKITTFAIKWKIRQEFVQNVFPQWFWLEMLANLAHKIVQSAIRTIQHQFVVNVTTYSTQIQIRLNVKLALMVIKFWTRLFLGCTKCDTTGKCSTCAIGYRLNSATCTKCTPAYCAECTDVIRYIINLIFLVNLHKMYGTIFPL